MAKGKIIVLSGASSVGKSAIRNLLLEDKDLKLFYSISMTTRPMKEDEVDGQDYYFVDHRSFADSLKKQELLEYTTFSGYYYGTPSQQVDFLVQHGKNVLIEVEAQGATQIKLNRPEALCFFVVPESMEELEKQIRLRYKDDENTIRERINKAKVELELGTVFNHTVRNDEPEKAVDYIKSIVLGKKNL